MKKGVFAVFLLVNAVALFCAFNPWIAEWRDHGIILLVVETIFLALIAAPVCIYRFTHRRKSFTKSLDDSLRNVMDFKAGQV